MGDVLLAAVLLSAPPGTPEPTPAPDQWDRVRGGLVAAAVRWEVLDPREERWTLARPEDWQPELDALRRRCRDLADAPALAEADRFPPRDVTNEGARFNREYRKRLEESAGWEADREDLYRAVVREADLLYAAWDAARDARCGHYYVATRRQALKALKDSLGPDAFARGELPPAAPVWRFNELR